MIITSLSLSLDFHIENHAGASKASCRRPGLSDNCPPKTKRIILLLLLLLLLCVYIYVYIYIYIHIHVCV